LCEVTKEGRAANCQVQSETPPGVGFGAAALAVATDFRFKPMLVDCRPVDGGKINVPIVFPPASG
jgi:protein TonB